MKVKLNLIGLLFLTIIFTGCNFGGKPDNFDYGHIEKNKYLNSFFGMELTVPDNWIVQNKEQTENISKMGKKMVAGDDENLQAVIEASEINTANLITVFQYEVGTAVDYNPGFMLVAENIKNAPGVKTGGDYLFQTRKILKQAQVSYNYIDNNFTKLSLDNQNFYLMNCSIDYSGIRIKQKYYSTIVNGFALTAIISYMTDEQKDSLEKIINSIKFSK